MKKKSKSSLPKSMSYPNVIGYLTARMVKEFNKWIDGQTCPIVDGDTHYYTHDVIRFADMIFDKKPTYFD